MLRHGGRIAASTGRARSTSCRRGRPVRCSRRAIQLARGPWRIRTRTWAGRSPLAGDYEGVDAVLGFFGKLIELSGGTFQVQLHDVMANDMHVASLHTNRAERNGRRLDLRVVLISHVRDGKSVEVWNFFEDQYAAAEFWS